MRSSSGDYLAVGEQMIQRLTERVPELRDVPTWPTAAMWR